MFDRLRFKSKKTDASSSPSASTASVLPGHKEETVDSSSPTLAAGSHPSAANLLGRSSSNGSTHLLQQKTSLTSLNNLYDSHHHSRSNLNLMNNTKGNDNYKVPLEDNSCSIKVPIPDTEDRPRSQTINNFSQYQQDSSQHTSHDSERRSSQGPRTNLATKPAVGTYAGATVTSTPPPDTPSVGPASSGVTPSPASASAPPSAYASAASSATPSRSSSTSNRGGAGISTGSFTPLSATPPLTPRLAHEVADISHANGHDTPAGAGSLGNADLANHALARDRPASLPQHAHPSGQSASSTPATAATVVGHYQRQQQLQQQQVPVIYGGAFSRADEGAMSPSTVFVSSPISYQPPSNALTLQGSTQQQQQQTLHPQDGFQHQQVSVVSGGASNSAASAPDSQATDAEISNDSMHRARSLVQQAFAANRETLHKQQQYQEQQMRQFQEDSSNRRSSSSYSVPQKKELQGEPQSLSSSSTALGQDMPIVSALAVAAALASENSSPDHGTQQQTDTHITSINTVPLLLQDDNQQQRSRDRTTSAPGTTGQFESPASVNPAPYPVTGTNQACASSTGINGGTGSHAHGHVAGAGGAGYGGIAGGGSSFFPSPISRASTSMAAAHLVTHDVRQVSGRSHIEDGAGPLVLMAIGKTGQGKSSLLNKIMGTNELKASASVRAVTKGIAERTGWGRFEDSRRVLVTVADTPGLADTEGDDEKNIPILQEYIRSVGTRVGVSAFLLVFKIDSGVDMIVTILQAFNEIMKDFPNFWDNVVLVFTGCDYRRNVMNTKQLYHEEVQRQLQEHFFKDLYSSSGGEGSSGTDHRPSLSTESSSTSTGTTTTISSNGTLNGSSTMGMLSEELTPVVPMVFLTCAEAPCGFSLGEKCDCKARTTFLNAGIKRLWYAVRNKKRWVLDQDENDDLLGHS
ncbi:hypothetical protein BGZ75_010087 [Mortierella antarctica]|nr:hypothetical protein BGZ75_010086 [Mortierella antarctica]KAF9978250.1 hypothetical protein BGZ75_010087 [Mortierella antarctica]